MILPILEFPVLPFKIPSRYPISTELPVNLIDLIENNKLRKALLSICQESICDEEKEFYSFDTWWRAPVPGIHFQGLKIKVKVHF